MVTLTTVPTEVALPTELAQAVRSVQHPTASALVSLYQQRTSTSTLDGAGVPWRSDICFFNADDLVLASDNVEMDSFIGRIRIQWKRLSSSTDPMSIINVVVLGWRVSRLINRKYNLTLLRSSKSDRKSRGKLQYIEISFVPIESRPFDCNGKVNKIYR